MTSLVVHLNRGNLYAVDPTATAFESAGPFTVELRNHGQPVHVHMRLDEELSRVARLNGTNLFVDAETVVTVPVEVADGVPDVRGMLKVVSGYGKGTEHVEVHLSDGVDSGMPVDEDLGRPDPPDRDDPVESRGGDGSGGDTAGDLASDRGLRQAVADARGTLVVGALVVLSLALSGVAFRSAPSLGVVLGIFTVLIGIGVAAYVMAR